MAKLDKKTDAEFDRLLMISRQLDLFGDNPSEEERKRAEIQIQEISNRITKSKKRKKIDAKEG